MIRPLVNQLTVHYYIQIHNLYPKLPLNEQVNTIHKNKIKHGFLETNLISPWTSSLPQWSQTRHRLRKPQTKPQSKYNPKHEPQTPPLKPPKTWTLAKTHIKTQQNHPKKFNSNSSLLLLLLLPQTDFVKSKKIIQDPLQHIELKEKTWALLQMESNIGTTSRKYQIKENESLTTNRPQPKKKPTIFSKQGTLP